MNFTEVLTKLKNDGNLRRLPSSLTPEVSDFSSNDYLGLAANKDLTTEFLETTPDLSFSSSASRLLASRQDDYFSLETLLEKEYNRPALIFNSGYHANTGLVSALSSGAKTLFIADRLIHASIIDGLILSRADFKRFPHNDVESIRKIIEKQRKDYERIVVITETVFSMEGDKAPLNDFLKLKEDYPEIILYVDEAHAFGVAGRKGLGLAQQTPDPSAFDIIVCPLGKAAASMGAFVICNEPLKDFFINHSRSLIFSTALPPVQVKWSEFVIKKILTMDKEREYLNYLGKELSGILKQFNPDVAILPSHIQPLILGDSHKVVALSQHLAQKGIKALPIRRPTVPPGTERIRFSLSAAMGMHDLEKLHFALQSVNEYKVSDQR